VSDTPYVDIPLGPYEPDWGGLPRSEAPGYLVDAVGVRSTPSGYRGMPQLQNVAGSVVFTGTGGVGRGHVAPISNGEVRILVIADIAADSPRLYVSTDYGQTWETAIALSSGDEWGFDFAPYDNRVFLTLGTASTYFYDLDDTPINLTAVSGAPVASTGARVRDHLVLGGLWDLTDYRVEKTAVQWSAIGDPEDWPTPGTADARAKQAGIQYLPRQYGWVGKVVGGEKFGLIFQERAITRMTYVGGSAVFEFDTFETTEGCGELDVPGTQQLVPAAVVALGSNRWIWVNDHGVFATDGYSIQSLSKGVIDEALFASTISFPDSIGGRARSAAYDQLRGLVVFKTGSTSQLTYDVKSGAFGFVESSSYNSVFSGKTALTNGKIQIYNITTGRQIQRLDGANDGVALQTGYIEIDPGYNVQLQGAHLLGTGTGSLTLAVKTAATSSACDLSQSGFTSLTAANLGQKKTGRATAQYIAFRITGTGAESQLIRGIRVYYTRAQPSP
jgi:hypothetical protein